MNSKCLLVLTLFSTFLMTGCGTRAIRVTSRQPVMLAEDVNARVWVKDAEGMWVRSSNRVVLEEGAIVISDVDAAQISYAEAKERRNGGLFAWLRGIVSTGEAEMKDLIEHAEE